MSPEEFRAALKELGWSQAEAARQLGQPRSRINDWWHGRRKITRSPAAHLRTHLELARCRRSLEATAEVAMRLLEE